MELHNLKSGAPHVELCGYIIELWYSAILGFCPHIKTKQKISSHDFHFLPLFLAVLVGSMTSATTNTIYGMRDPALVDM